MHAMKDQDKTDGQFTNELKQLRKRIAESEKLEAKHRQVEKALWETDERYQAIFNRTLYCVFVHDFQGRFLDANDTALNLLGYKKKEIPTLNFSQVFAEDHLQKAIKIIEEVKRFGSLTEPIEYKLKKRDGSYVWVEAEGSVIYRGGKPYAVQGIARDITERKRTEEALRESAEQYRIITNTTMDGFVKLALDGRILDMNEAYCHMLAYSKEELLMMTVADIEAKETPDKVKKHIKKIIEVGSDRFESRLRRKDGRIIDVEISLTFLRHLGHILVFLRDITDRKRAEEVLQRSYDQLRETFIATVNALASTVEMKDPYTAGHQRWVTRLACAIAKEMDLPEEQIEGIRMAGLIHDIGKINIPAEILTKPGHLSEIQYNMVKIHPQVGCDILKEIKFPWPVAEIVLQHHERVDGSGYPQGFSGAEILLEARILAVADVVEAMASHRPYRAAHGIVRALDEISRNKGTLYDPDVVDVCLKLFEQGFRFD
jgi:PAS domain S-box-containing protein/putative nucleotidyltransferase with HDIG domain